MDKPTLQKNLMRKTHYPCRSHRDHFSGFSLIELMVGLTLGALLIAAVTGVFLSGNKSYREDNRFARMEENGRFAMKFLVDDISMAGFWGFAARPSLVSSSVPGTLCGLAVNTSKPINVLHNPTAASVNSSYPCVATANFQAGSDVVTIKRVRGASVSAPPVTSTNIYLRTEGSNASTAELIGYTGTPVSSSQYWDYISRIYYIRNYSVTASDGIPTLVRKSLSGSTNMVDEPLVDGIERFEIEFGIDESNPKDGIPERFLTAPDDTELTKAVSARIYVLSRSTDADPGYINNKTYNLGQTTYTVNDHYYRRVYSTTVSLRNPAYSSRLP